MGQYRRDSLADVPGLYYPGTVRQLADTTELVSYTNALGSFTFEQPIYTKEMKLEELSSLPYLVPPETAPVLYTKGIREKNGE